MPESCGHDGASLVLKANRRELLLKPAAAWCFLVTSIPVGSAVASPAPGVCGVKHPFSYSDDWKGTAFSPLSLEQAVMSAAASSSYEEALFCWPMARWPDPILRRPASKVDPRLLGTDILRKACRYLANTAVKEGAVGLAAEQCGIDARIIYLKEIKERGMAASRSSSSLTMTNPRIVGRSPESEMKVWREHCLVLPPSFSAVVLRDAWVEVEYQDGDDGSGVWKRIKLEGEPARAFQHEYDHDRGILITDHVGFEDMESDLMASIERDGHQTRMLLAYSRLVDEKFVA